MKNHLLLILLTLNLTLMIASCTSKAENPRKIILLDEGWKFKKGENPNAETTNYDDSNWESVIVPHDWAIYGPFDSTIDVQYSRPVVKGKPLPSVMTGRTGALPHIGIGWYRKTLELPADLKGKNISVEFDGAMSHAQVFLNGNFIGTWPYGYSSFAFDITDKINFGQNNILAVRLENFPFSSRWYPGAGLYRNVRLVITDPVHIDHWGTYITTKKSEGLDFEVKVKTNLVNSSGTGKEIKLVTEIQNSGGRIINQSETNFKIDSRGITEHMIKVRKPDLWSPETPVLYKAVSSVFFGETLLDRYETNFGFRYFRFEKDKGFFLNDKNIKFKGVCNHHDLGALGTAVNYRAIERQLELLKEMGCNAIRTSHNPPAPELLDLCDRMGFMVMDEAFDEWITPKIENGYHTLYPEWAEKDLQALIRRDRNHPSVILWSIGNEVPDQRSVNGAQVAMFLRDICHREDPTRPVTAGYDYWREAIHNGLADAVDVPGWNYKPRFYKEIHDSFPDWKMIGTETASTVSSRGEYFVPARVSRNPWHPNYQVSSYDIECTSWATLPDLEFAAQEDYPFMAGEFVWTGFDYLGEPTPYNEIWPSRSSYFGILDLCGIPKDRYYLYQSHWSDKKVLHLLPHWNWEGHEGDTIPVYCYTNYESAELFLNGISQGIRKKDPSGMLSRYRLKWDNVVYKPGVILVKAYDKSGKTAETREIHTAGNPVKIILQPDRSELTANGKDLTYVTVSLIDKNGYPCPLAKNSITFRIEGEGTFRAVDNGDATSLLPFQGNRMNLYNGKCMAIIQSGKNTGEIKLVVEADGIEAAEIFIKVQNQ